MNDLKTALDLFYATCHVKGYQVEIVNQNETIIKTDGEEITLKLVYKEDNQLELFFYKEENTNDNFVNAIMELFAKVINRAEKVTN